MRVVVDANILLEGRFGQARAQLLDIGGHVNRLDVEEFVEAFRITLGGELPDVPEVGLAD